MSTEDLQERTAEIAAAVIDRIASDEEFREALKANPEGAMELAGFAAQVDELAESIEADEDEVSGFASIAPRLAQINFRTIRGTTIVASSPPSAGCCGASADGRFSLTRR